MEIRSKDKPVIGWREWVELPDLGIKAIKAKIDTGARTSSLHAFDIHEIKKNGKVFVSFKVNPGQRDKSKVVSSVAPLLGIRSVRNSGGVVTSRPVILTPVRIGHLVLEIELTLIGRDEMGFRMLLGRQGVRNVFLVNPGRSYLLSQNKRRTK